MGERIVVLGGGFAGVSTARELSKQLRREQRLTNIWYAVATLLLAAVIALAAWTVWRA